MRSVWGLSAPVADLVVRLADCGYITAAPHPYHCIEDPVVTDRKFKQARRYHETLTTEGLTCDIESAQAWIRAQGAQKVAVIGFSMGGTLAVWAPATLHIDAAVAFYGTSVASPSWPGILRYSVRAVQKIVTELHTTSRRILDEFTNQPADHPSGVSGLLRDEIPAGLICLDNSREHDWLVLRDNFRNSSPTVKEGGGS